MAILRFTKALTIQHVAMLRCDILNGLSDNDSVTLDVIPDIAADLSAVQLIAAARLHANTNGKQFALANPASGPLRDALEQGGFLENGTRDDHAFWLHREGGK